MQNETRYYLNKEGLDTLVTKLGNQYKRTKSKNIGYVTITDETTGETTRELKDADNFPTIGAVVDYVLKEIKTESDRAENAEDLLHQALAGEIERAGEAEDALHQEIIAEKERAEAAEDSLRRGAINEENRATSMESLLSSLISEEIIRAQNVEQQLTQNIQQLSADKANKSELAEVATSGSYNDLNNKPTKVSLFTNDRLYSTSTEVLDAILTAISNLINGAPEALDTLKEIADKLGDDDNVIGEMLNSIAENKTKIEEIYNKKDIELFDYLFDDGTTGSEIGDKTPVGICIAPASHFADGKSRFMSLKEMTTGSTAGTTSHEYIYWQNDSQYVDLPLTNYNKVITIDSDGTSNGTQSYGYLPVDEKDGFNKSYNGMSYSQHAENGKYCPSPFLSDGTKNDVYFTSGQALADIDGSSNTSVILTADNAKYLAAKVCRSFNPGTHSGEWYLPAMGELGYVMVQWKAIDEAIVAANEAKAGSGVQLDGNTAYWSSTECGSDAAWRLGPGTSDMYGYNKYGDRYVRAFLALPESSGLLKDLQDFTNSLQLQINTIQSNIELINSSIDEINNTIEEDEETLNTLSGNLNGLSTQVETLSGKTTQLETGLSNVYTKTESDNRYVNKSLLWTGTQAEYDAIVTKDVNTFYFIIGE